MLKYAVPCVISMLVAALYNIVDQIFIANADYLGSYGNAANTVVFPMTVVAIALAVMVGDGCCAFVSIRLGSGNDEKARQGIGSSVLTVIAMSLVLTILYLVFQEQILTAFGARVNEETFQFSKEYFFWLTTLYNIRCINRLAVYATVNAARLKQNAQPKQLGCAFLNLIYFHR